LILLCVVITKLFSYNFLMKTVIKPPVAILGFGVEGQYALDFLKTQKISDITICDENESVEIPKNAKSQLGSKAFKDLKAFRTIIRSPGVHYRLPGILEARKAGCTVTSMTELTLEQAANRMTAITGSNGKTTTVAMLDKILTAHYKGKIIVGGNDRTPVLQEAIKRPNELILMEVSSFQFADIKMSPHIAAVLNITPNHLDWHENLEEYANAKSNLIAHQSYLDWCILNRNDENSSRLGKKTPGKIFWLGTDEGNDWATWKGDKLVAKFEDKEATILSKKDITIKTHPDNILCAIAVSLIHRVTPTLIKEQLAKFVGAEHRLEFVKEVEGVKFYNDSACTTPESTKVAINEFPEGKLILLLGGSSKNADFSFLAHDIIEHRVRPYLYGKEGPRIQEAIKAEDEYYPIMMLDESDDFPAIVIRALEMAQPGDNIVLSPACASFDMFKNAKDRGKQFKEIVKNLD
ncbi:UDP-N-acetylmuramoyl-L-alanine--D-glutamate ligase, partial [Candidatus Peregrinibacteria bacterium]|nr:UDP-N-acetylmuramoyl-L-alanine--D-glutamate ligase [Candidatus Peregrinibacteria bacterium]